MMHAVLYGTGTFLMALLNALLLPGIFPGIFAETRWTVGRELAMMLWQLFTISFINLFISGVLYAVPLTATSLLRYFLYTGAVGVFPVSFVVLAKYILLLRRYRSAAVDIGRQLPAQEEVEEQITAGRLITLLGDNQGELLQLSAAELICIEAADNYVRVHCLRADKPSAAMLRSSLKKMEEMLSGLPQFFRCHRTYLVNLDRVTGVSGNAQGLKLQLEGFTGPVPVSRSLNKELQSRLQQRREVPVRP